LSNENPVWDVYDLLRTARLNVKYYSRRLAVIERDNFLLELVIAISAPSSAIAGLFFWDTEAGELVWKGFGILAALFAVIKPLLKLTEKIKKYEETLTGYKTLDNDLQLIVSQIKQKQGYSSSLQKEFNKAFERKKLLVTSEAERQEDISLKRKLQEEVCIELPKSHFFIPGE